MRGRGAGALLLLALLAPGLRAQQPDSIWYQDRGAQPRPLPHGETRIDTALKLAALLHDGRVTGFYDGQFAAVKDRFDDLASIAGDPDMSHVLRLVAVMALQEAGDGEPVRKALEPLLIPAHREFQIEVESRDPQMVDDENWLRDYFVADLSQHARFSLAKDGQPGAVRAKIRQMELSVNDNMDELLDPSVVSDTLQARLKGVPDGRDTIFQIGYHYQQFDDFEHAAEWFNKLCDNLPGHRDTQMAHYNLGCIDALTGHPEEAMEHLRNAHAVGFTNVEWLQEDGDLTSLRGRPDFAALVAQMRNQPPPSAPPATPPGPEGRR